MRRTICNQIVTFAMPVMISILLSGLQSCIQSNSKQIKIVYVNSYHQGFPPSDDITRGVMENITSDNYEIISCFMDTKRNPSDTYIIQKAKELFDSIKKTDPDVLIVSDDNALKYLVVPYFQEDDLPVVFCGINWSVDQYDIARCNITGILEILPIRELVGTMKEYYPEMKRILVLNENTTTSRKTQPLLDTLLGNLDLEVSQKLVNDFDEWKSTFSRANDTYDIIYLQTKGAIKGWNDTAARKYIEQHIKVPVVTCEEFMMPFAVFGLTQLSEEQGMKAAEMALNIVSGTDPSDIPITMNKMSKIWINQELAELIGFQAGTELQNRAVILP